MKKLGAIIIAMALVLGLSQCKKQDPITTPDANDGKVYITVNVNNGAKHEIYPSTGAYVFTNGDILYVGNNGHFVGTLEYQSGAFSGTIDSPVTTDYLHFYFTGGKTPATNPTTSTTSFTVNISDQSSKLPVLSYGRSTQLYTDANATYSTTLRNQCGLVKFVSSITTVYPFAVSGMKTTATIDFATPGITPTDATGTVKLYSVSGSEKWAILLPQDEVTDAKVNYGGSVTLPSGGTTAISTVTLAGTITVPAIAANSYLNNGIGLFPTLTDGFLSGSFTVSPGHKVRFSKGNLQYNKANSEWSFMENQYDIVETNNQNVGENYANQNMVSLFGWSTSGYNHNNGAYQPWATSTTTNQYYAYGNSQYGLYSQNGQADWGYNAISNGGNTENYGWFTPYTNHIFYILYNRDGIRYAKAIVNGVNGLIVLPDDWNTSIYTLNNTNTMEAQFNSNNISASEWTNTLEPSGAIFLPAAGQRNGSGVFNDGSFGGYWGSETTNNLACRFYFTDELISFSVDSNRTGYSVRLVGYVL